MSNKYPVIMNISVTQDDIDEAKCGDPNKCMIKRAVKREIGGHGYVKVDASGIAITRRDDYREKAFMPKTALRNMLLFDGNKTSVRPFTFKVKWFKTTAIMRPERTKQIADAYKKRIAAGGKKKPTYYGKQKRTSGISVAAGQL